MGRPRYRRGPHVPAIFPSPLVARPMPRNVEFKARAADPVAVRRAAEALATEGPTVLVQDDTFFARADGRLKLRVVNDAAELVHYHRADAHGPRVSAYTRVPVAEPDALRDLLGAAYGMAGRVTKTRTLLLTGRARIHLDDVDGLGTFAEVEVVLAGDEPLDAGEAEAHRLMQALGLAETDLEPRAYVDLLA